MAEFGDWGPNFLKWLLLRTRWYKWPSSDTFALNPDSNKYTTLYIFLGFLVKSRAHRKQTNRVAMWQRWAANLLRPLSHTSRMNLYGFSSCRSSLMLFTVPGIYLNNNTRRRWRHSCNIMGPAVPQEWPRTRDFLLGAGIKPGVGWFMTP